MQTLLLNTVAQGYRYINHYLCSVRLKQCTFFLKTVAPVVAEL